MALISKCPLQWISCLLYWHTMIVYFPTFLLQAVESWLVDRAVLPIENSLGGSIHRNYDLLLRHRLHIVGEVKFAVRHCLLANHGVKVEDLKRVLSHSQVCCTLILHSFSLLFHETCLKLGHISGSCSV